MRCDDDKALLEKMDFVEEESQLDGEIAEYDALVVEAYKLEGTVSKLALAMDKATSISTLKVAKQTLSKPKTMRGFGVIQQLVSFELSDGQAVSIIFNVSDSEANASAKMTKDDLLVAWKYKLNSRDITAAVQPNATQNVSLNMIASRIMGLADANSEKFVAAQKKKDAMQTELANTNQRVKDLQGQEQSLIQEIADLQKQLDEAGKQTTNDYSKYPVIANDDRYGQIIEVPTIWGDKVRVAKRQLENSGRTLLKRFTKSGGEIDGDSIHRENLLIGNAKLTATAQIEKELKEKGYKVAPFPKSKQQEMKLIDAGYIGYSLDGKGWIKPSFTLAVIYAIPPVVSHDEELEVDELPNLGMAKITSVGGENIYIEKDGKRYFSKVGNTGRYAVGDFNFSQENHYSEKIIAALVANHGWTASTNSSATKEFTGMAAGGELSDGTRMLTARFDNKGRYIGIDKDGFDSTPIPETDMDMRPYMTDAQGGAKAFNDMVEAYVVKQREALKPVSAPTPAAKSANEPPMTNPDRVKLSTPKDILNSNLTLDEKLVEAQKLFNQEKSNAAKNKVKFDESNKFYLQNLRNARGGYLYTDLPKNASLNSVIHASIGITAGFIELLEEMKVNPPVPHIQPPEPVADIGDTVIGDMKLSDLFKVDMAKKSNGSPELRIARQSILDAEDAAANAIQSNSIDAFSKYADMFPKTYNALLNWIKPPMTNPKTGDIKQDVFTVKNKANASGGFWGDLKATNGNGDISVFLPKGFTKGLSDGMVVKATAFFQYGRWDIKSVDEIIDDPLKEERENKAKTSYEKPEINAADAGNLLYEMDANKVDSVTLKEGFGNSITYSREEVMAVINKLRGKSNPDRDYLQSIIDGKADLSNADEIEAKLTDINERLDADLEPLFEQAAEVFAQYGIAQAAMN